MIEDATIVVGGQHHPTRLHEHGSGPSYRFQPSNEWLEEGYMEGAKENLEALKATGGDTLAFYRDGQLYELLTGVVWGPIECMYDEHYIMHLRWKGDDREQ